MRRRDTLGGSMSRLRPAICALAFIGLSMQMSSAQSEKGSLTGTISDPNGAAVDGAPIQAKNKATGAVARVSSKPDGRYTLALVPGDYEFSIVMPCCAYQGVNRDVVLEAGKTALLDIRLAETVNGTTLGDDPGRLANVMRKRAKIPSRPVPRLAGGRPDLSGVWVAIDDPYPEQPQVLPWAAALIQERQENHGKDAPHNHCLPGPPPVPGSSAPFIEKFVQTGSLLVILFEDVSRLSPGFSRRARPSVELGSHLDGTLDWQVGRRHAGVGHRRF